MAHSWGKTTHAFLARLCVSKHALLVYAQATGALVVGKRGGASGVYRG